MAPEIIAQSAASHSNHFNQIVFLHSTGFLVTKSERTLAASSRYSLRRPMF
jgi:hypothetical protein